MMENKAGVLLASPLGSGKTYVALKALLTAIYHPDSNIAWKNRPVLMIMTPIYIFRTYAIIRDLVRKESDITISDGSDITMLGGKTIVLQAYSSLRQTELSKVSWGAILLDDCHLAQDSSSGIYTFLRTAKSNFLLGTSTTPFPDGAKSAPAMFRLFNPKGYLYTKAQYPKGEP
ncbi:hypothetical protein BDZ91DRAFT_303927 [Kalaharituber pfeilii]|nr:hypothetical protein BDZ91DRAFT_303927 [Kalaharituber pfeilii]